MRGKAVVADGSGGSQDAVEVHVSRITVARVVSFYFPCAI